MRRGFTLIELLVVIGILALLISIGLANFARAKDRAKEAQVKTSVHTIQTVLERFAVDNNGLYPGYIWGGERGSWTQGTQPLDDWRVLDPLIRYGYLESYPRNPFVRPSDASSILQLFNNDPRFGSSGDIMGNVLSDPNFPSSGYGPWGCDPSARRAMAFFGVGGDNKKHFLPGEFIYRSYHNILPDGGEYAVVPGQTAGTDTESATVAEDYMLAAYGSTRSVGKDVLNGSLFGSEPTYGSNPSDPGDVFPNIVARDGWDTNGNGVIDPEEVDNVGSKRPLWTNPDGSPDGIVVVVTSGGSNVEG